MPDDRRPAKPRIRAQRRDAIANREALLGAATTALTHDPDASIEDIAAYAGLSRRAVYGHFANRDELLAEVLVRGAAQLTAGLDPIGHSDARVEIALYASHLWGASENARVITLLAVRGKGRDRVARILEPLRAHLRSTVERGAQAGQIRPDIEAGQLARLIEAAVLAVFDETTLTFLSDERGRRLAMLTALSVAGLGWEQGIELVDTTAALRPRDIPAPDLRP